MQNTKKEKSWSWLGFLFMPYYYAGYGDLKKGLWVSVLVGVFGEIFSELMLFDNLLFLISLGIFFLVGFGIAMYGGMYAKEDLPIKEQKFSWLNVLYAWLAYIAGTLMVLMLFSYSASSTPKCNDLETKELVKQISRDEFKKQGMSGLDFTLSNIRTSSYNKEIDKYECAAELAVFNSAGVEFVSSSITYTSQMVEDSEKFYVEVFGL